MSLSSLTDRYTQARDCGDGHPERPPESSRKSWAGDAGEPAPVSKAPALSCLMRSSTGSA